MVLKVAVLCVSILAVSATAPVGIAVHNTGTSTTSKNQDSHGNYAFAYDIVDEHGASNSRSEAGDAFGNKKGYYTLYDTDGRARTVDYVADEHGFRAVVNTNEPGTAQSYPAGVIINSPYQEPAAPDAAPVSIVHDVHVPVSGHLTPVSSKTISTLSHTAPAVVFDQPAPVAVAHTVPSAYSTKSVISHTVPVAAHKPVTVPYVHPSPPVSYPYKSMVSHAAAPIATAHSVPLTYSSKSVVSSIAPFETVSHAKSLAVANPIHVSYSPKYIASNVAPIAKHYIASPFSIGRYKSIYNGGLGLSNFGYNHGLFGPIAYNKKFYNHGLQEYGLRHLLYGNTYGHGHDGFGYGILRPHIEGHSYGKDIYGYGGLKSHSY